MEERRASVSVAQRVADAILATGNTPESVAAATDLTVPDLNERLSGASPFTIRELVTVGGFLHFPASHFLEGARA